jgi:hypothetical protein
LNDNPFVRRDAEGQLPQAPAPPQQKHPTRNNADAIAQVIARSALLMPRLIARAGWQSTQLRWNQPGRRQRKRGEKKIGVALMDESAKLSPIEQARRQRIDECWERKLIEQEHQRDEAERRSFHKTPGIRTASSEDGVAVSGSRRPRPDREPPKHTKGSPADG